MPYDDDDDLFGEDFDFVDDDDDESSTEEPEKSSEKKAEPKGRKPPAGRGKPAAGPPRPRGRAPAPAPPRDGRRDRDAAPVEPPDAASDLGDQPDGDEPRASDDAPPEPTGPPADHCVHIYEYGTLKRTIPRKFTDEEAVSFAEEYTRTGKAYGRYAIATPDDEEPSEQFADAAKG